MHDHSPVQQPSPTIGEQIGSDKGGGEQPQASHSMWWMVACCAPMILIVLAILLGVFGPL